MRVAAIQLTSTAERARNLACAEQLLAAAARDGARLIVLPEMFNVLGDADVLRAGAEPLDGPTLRWAGEQARRHGIWLVAGSIMERVEGEPRIFNTSCLFDANGERRATYRKIHLFDCDVAGASYHESASVMPGRDIVRAEADGVPLGLSICYDLRFPELFRILALDGVRLIVLASAFTERTGRDHWEVLVRARHRESGFCDRSESGGREYAEPTLVWPLDDRRSVGRRVGASAGSRELHRRRGGFGRAGGRAGAAAQLGESPAGSVSLTHIRGKFGERPCTIYSRIALSSAVRSG
jgi:predicted amidohydrolase